MHLSFPTFEEPKANLCANDRQNLFASRQSENLDFFEKYYAPKHSKVNIFLGGGVCTDTLRTQYCEYECYRGIMGLFCLRYPCPKSAKTNLSGEIVVLNKLGDSLTPPLSLNVLS